MARGSRKSGKGKPEAKSPPASSAPYGVDMSRICGSRLRRFVQKIASRPKPNGDPTNAICTKFRMVDEAVERIIPRDPYEQAIRPAR